ALNMTLPPRQFNRYAGLVAFLCAGASFAGAKSLDWPGKEREMRLSLDLLCRQEYAAARAGFEILFKEEPIARDYWVGAVQMARYEDWGDTLALAEAESSWTRIREVDCP